MTKRPLPLVVALLIAVSVVAGCGGDEGDQGSTGTTEATSTGSAEDKPSQQQSAPASGDERAGDSSGSGDSDSSDEAPAPSDSSAQEPEPLSAEQTAEACEQNAESAERLPKRSREQFERICDLAAEGDEEGLRDEIRDLCRQMVENSLPKDSPQREEALANCDRDMK